MNFSHILLFFILSICFTPILSQTKCRTSGKWVLLGVPKAQLYPLLPEGVFFDNHPFMKELGEDSHPVFLEFNKQHDCWFFYIFPAPSMHEFKIQIPYTMTLNMTGAIYKPLVLTDKWVNTIGSKFFYGLPTFTTDFTGDGVNEFNMVNQEEGISVKASFSYSGSNISNFNDTKFFHDSYIRMNQHPWFTDELNFNVNDPHCASNTYFWKKNVNLRYMNATINLQWKVFNQTFLVDSLENNIIGGMEVDVDLVISHRQKCKNFYTEKKVDL